MTNANGLASGDPYCGPLGGEQRHSFLAVWPAHDQRRFSSTCHHPADVDRRRHPQKSRSTAAELSATESRSLAARLARQSPLSSFTTSTATKFRIEANSCRCAETTLGPTAGTPAGSISGDGVSVTGATARSAAQRAPPRRELAPATAIGSGNGVGIFLDSTATSATIQGNYIGTNAAGTAEIHNRAQGIRSFAASTSRGRQRSRPRERDLGQPLLGCRLRGRQRSLHGNRIGTGTRPGLRRYPTPMGCAPFSQPMWLFCWGTFAGTKADLISGNSGYGIDVWDSSTVQIQAEPHRHKGRRSQRSRQRLRRRRLRLAIFRCR